jgi:hypothetical protein
MHGAVVVVVLVVVLVVVVVVVVAAPKQWPLRQTLEQHCSFLLHFDWGRLPDGLQRLSA